MSEKTNSELNNEEVLDSAAENTEEITAEETTAVIENTDTENAEATVEAADVENTITADEISDTENTENTEDTEGAQESEAIVDTAENSALETTEATEEVTPEKKKTPLQVPVIIACCILVAALLGFLVYYAFFLKEPENVTWTNDVDNVTYYYDFKSDGTFTGYLGSIEMNGSFQKTKADGNYTVTVDKTFGSFYQNMPATYSIKGSRLLGNQEMTCTYSEDYEFTLKQGKREKKLLDLPQDFTADEELVGTWIFKYMNYDIYKVTFNKDGSMLLEFIQDGIKYNGIYTIEGSTINFTYYVTDSTVVPIDYKVDGDAMTFMGYQFVREGSELEKATSDQQVLTPQAAETQVAEAATEAATEAAQSN